MDKQQDSQVFDRPIGLFWTTLNDHLMEISIDADGKAFIHPEIILGSGYPKEVSVCTE